MNRMRPEPSAQASEEDRLRARIRELECTIANERHVNCVLDRASRQCSIKVATASSSSSSSDGSSSLSSVEKISMTETKAQMERTMESRFGEMTHEMDSVKSRLYSRMDELERNVEELQSKCQSLERSLADGRERCHCLETGCESLERSERRTLVKERKWKYPAPPAAAPTPVVVSPPAVREAPPPAPAPPIRVQTTKQSKSREDFLSKRRRSSAISQLDLPDSEIIGMWTK